ncbi:MAG: GTP-binding protein [Eubacterium sp.]
MIARKGRIEDGNTISDYDKEEISRHFSLSASVVPVEWNGLKINILDAPGYFDFVGQLEDAMSVADAAVIVVNGKAGVEVGTVKAWEICERRQIPRIFFVTNMDDPNAKYGNRRTVKRTLWKENSTIPFTYSGKREINRIC